MDRVRFDPTTFQLLYELVRLKTFTSTVSYSDIPFVLAERVTL